MITLQSKSYPRHQVRLFSDNYFYILTGSQTNYTNIVYKFTRIVEWRFVCRQ